MDGKYIIILLFIFLVFLMGSINSTITNNFNNTTGSQDHFNLSNLSYADSGHIGFQASDTLNDDVAGLGYVTNETGNFLNSSIGGEVNGNVIINTTGNIQTTIGNVYNGSGFALSAPNAQSNVVVIYDGSCQYLTQTTNAYFEASVPDWNKYNTSQDSLISMQRTCSNPANLPSVSVYSSTETSNPFWNFNRLFYYDTTTFYVDNINLTSAKLAGSGNAYACLDSTGKFYRGSPTC